MNNCIIQNQMSLQMQILQTQIENLLNNNITNQYDKIKIIQAILHKLSAQRQLSQSHKLTPQFIYKHMDTQNEEIQMFSLQKSAIKRTDVFLSNSSQKGIRSNQSKQSQTQPNMHRLSSQMKESMLQNEQKKHESRKIKKQQIIELINKANGCINTLCNGLHKAYSHLVATRMGKDVKFQVESIYLAQLKHRVEQINKKLAQKMKTEDLIQFYSQNIVCLKDQIIKYQDKFILPQDQLKIPQPSKLFRIIVQ